MEKVIDWIIDHPLITISRLEVEAGIPATTIQKILKGEKRKLSAEQVKSVETILRRYGYK